MLVKDLMGSGPLLTVEETESLALALQMMLWSNVRHLPVLRAGKLVGVLSDRDVLRARAAAVTGTRSGTDPGNPLDRPVRSAMSAPAIITTLATEAAKAAALLLDKRIGCLPVLDGDRLAGVLTVTDFLGAEAGRRAVPVASDTHLRAQDVMAGHPLTVHEDDAVFDAVGRMVQEGARHLPVVDGENHPIGMLSDRDIRRVVGDPRRAKLDERAAVASTRHMRVGHVMTAKVATVAQTQPFSEVIEALLDHRVGALPVVDTEDHLVGIISYLDALKAAHDLLVVGGRGIPTAG
jgi:CBS domain-containing protein